MKTTDRDYNNPVLDKLMKLKYRINDAYRAGRITPKTDKDWVMGEIEKLRNGAKLDGDQMRVANNLWDKYGG